MDGCKFLIVRRDGSMPAWPSFVLGARDAAAPIALRAYADAAASLGYDTEYVASIRELADDFDRYRAEHGDGDPDAAPHREDNAAVVAAMNGDERSILVWPSENNGKPLRVCVPERDEHRDTERPHHAVFQLRAPSHAPAEGVGAIL
jgi:hypothetical protein